MRIRASNVHADVLRVYFGLSLGDAVSSELRKIFRYSRRALKGVVARRPDFFIAGFQKCGTTSLYNWLFQSPDLTPGQNKENNILAETPNRKLFYLGGFPSVFTAKRTGCGSHQIGFAPAGADTIKRCFPGSKIVFVVRDPSQRALSRYMDNQRKGSSRVFDPKFEESFEQIVRKEVAHYRQFGGSISVSEIHEYCAQYSPFGYPVGRGIYAPFVERFLQNDFDVFISSLDAIRNDAERELGKICDFLDVTQPSGIDLSARNSRPANVGGTVDQPVLDELAQFYRPFNERLEVIAGRRLFGECS